ncbi:MAG: hypothetical protein MZV64_48655 [Ignavibacteriales bacterium]|nr:hypothetical protein [Ignavibacteriales bacterium]
MAHVPGRRPRRRLPAAQGRHRDVRGEGRADATACCASRAAMKAASVGSDVGSRRRCSARWIARNSCCTTSRSQRARRHDRAAPKR